MSEQVSSEQNACAGGLAPVDRYEIGMEGDICGAVLDVKLSPRGEWMQYEDMKLAMCFVTGYLGEHKGLLEDLGADPKILASVQYIIDEIHKL